MLAAVPKVRPQDAPAWIRYLTGLWLSGLRLEESLDPIVGPGRPVYRRPDRPAARLPNLRRSAEGRPGRGSAHDARLCRVAAADARKPNGWGGCSSWTGLQTGEPMSPKRIGRIVAKIGKKAGVVVNKADGKYASAHDLRRAFRHPMGQAGHAGRVEAADASPSIETTMGYYVDLDAADVADELWASLGRLTTTRTTNSPNGPDNRNGPRR